MGHMKLNMQAHKFEIEKKFLEEQTSGKNVSIPVLNCLRYHSAAIHMNHDGRYQIQAAGIRQQVSAPTYVKLSPVCQSADQNTD